MAEGEAAIRLAGIRRSFGRTTAVDGIDLEVARGDVVALLGPNGAGKSTTIDVTLGLTPPDHGSVELFGTSPGVAVKKGRVGAMLQDGQLPPDLTVSELLTLVGALFDRSLPVADALDHAGVAELANRWAGKLSGGQTQRVRFAVAMICNPDLLILDEPTAGMDVESRLAFWTSMRAEADAGRTLLFATHYLDEADEHANRIVVIQHGRIVADGSAAEIKSVVSERVIRVTLPGPDLTRLSELPGVAAVTVRGEAAELRCSDSDAALRALLATHADARDIEVSGVDLTEAFVAITAAPDAGSTEENTR